MSARPSSRLLSAIRQACALAKPPIYSGAKARRPLDAKLEDLSWVAKAKQESAVLLIDLKKGAAGVTSAGSLAWVSHEQAAAMGGDEEGTVLLGRREQDAMPPSFLNPRYAKTASNLWCFAASVKAPEAISGIGSLHDFVGLREIVGTATAAEAALAGQARNLLLWHKNHAYCGVCGGKSVNAKGGWKRVCTNCGAMHFPRTDPVIISAVLSPDGKRCLLGRQAKWPKGRYSCLAGFVDPGETLEEAVAREVREESGVAVASGGIVYHSSQPWPNGPGGQLMNGFLAIAENESLQVDTEELETAQWVEVERIREALAGSLTQQGGGGTGAGVGSTDGGLMLPQPSAIAHALLSSACEAASILAVEK